MVHVRYSSLLLFWTLQCVTGHFCNLYDVTSTPLISLVALTTSECGFNCGMTSGCMNFGLCHDSTADNCSFYKSVSKTNCGTSSSVVCILFIKVFILIDNNVITVYDFLYVISYIKYFKYKIKYFRYSKIHHGIADQYKK